MEVSRTGAACAPASKEGGLPGSDEKVLYCLNIVLYGLNFLVAPPSSFAELAKAKKLFGSTSDKGTSMPWL